MGLSIEGDFVRNKYVVLRRAVSQPLLEFLNTYLDLRLSTGGFQVDTGIKSGFAAYGDPGFEALVAHLQPVVEQVVGLSLLPTYSFARQYVRGGALEPHVDRASCEVSLTLHLGATPACEWPIFVSRQFRETEPGLQVEGGTPIILHAGDLLVYRGMEVAHWREPLDTDQYNQVFLHYVEADGAHQDRMFDGRPSLGS